MLKNILNGIKFLKNKVVSRYPSILENGCFLFFKACYHEFRYSVTEEETALAECFGARKYFKKNKAKIDTIVSRLQDNESKKTYLSIIEYRKEEFFRRLFQRKKNAPVYHGYKNQYFINDFFKYGENEVLIDCGAYIGDSIESFSKVCPNYSKIIALEPDANNLKKIQESYKEEKRLFLINAGAWDKNCELYFIEDDYSSNSAISKEKKKNTISINVLSLDTIEEVKNSKITFIKMDIEGAELEALKGAEETIKKDKPRLAICLYHYNRHFIEIPEYIISIVPEYKFRVRHHGKEYTHETVLYAEF